MARDLKSDAGAPCTCTACVEACREKPGWLAPGDAERIAEHLDVPIERLFHEKLAVDWWVGGVHGTDDILVLSPAAERAPAGRRWPYEPFAGACTFLVDDRCSIHPVKPRECRLAGHPTPKWLHREIALLWESEEGQAQIRALSIDAEHGE